jgi:hypothetical protein
VLKTVVDALTWVVFIGFGVLGTVALFLIPVHYYPAILRRVSSRPAAVVLAVLLGIICGMGAWIVIGPYALITARNRPVPPLQNS